MKDLLEEERNRWLVRFVEEIPALHTAIGGTSGLVGLLHRVRDEWIIWRDRRLHLEVLDGIEPRGTVVFHHGYGAYARLYLPTLGLLAEEGFNVVALDRPGHGLSDGRRGDCTVACFARRGCLSHDGR